MNSLIEINKFFNDLPVRILGSHDRPIFYATEIEKLLNTRLTDHGFGGFAPIEIVQADERERLGIKTYREYKNGTLREHPDMILLTEFGVYRILMHSKAEIAERFRVWLYDVLYQLRTEGRYVVEQELQQLRIDNSTQRERVATLVEQRKSFENRMERLYIIEIPNDMSLIEPRSVHSDHLPDDDYDEYEDDIRANDSQSDDDEDSLQKKREERAKIQADPEYYNRVHMVNVSYPGYNTIDEVPVTYTYKISDTYTRNDQIYGTVKHYGFVNNARESIEKLSEYLEAYRLKSKPNTYYYNAPLDVIRSAADIIIRPREHGE